MKLSRRKIAAMAIAGRDNAVMVRRSFVLDVIGFTTRRNILANVEVWHRLPGAPLRNGVKGCSQEGHFDSERVAGCPPPSCSTFVGFGRISAELVSIKAWWPASSGCAFDESITP